MLNYFGVTLYAVWVLMTSIMAYLNQISFGIPPAMMAMVAKEPCDDEKYDMFRKSFYLLFMIAIVVLICFVYAINVDKGWVGVLLGSIDNEYLITAIEMVIVGVLLTLVKMPFSLYAQFFIGMNKVYISEIYTIVITILTFISLIITIYFQFDIIIFVMLSLGVQLLTSIISAVHVRLSYAHLKLYNLFDKRERVRSIVCSGYSFFQVGIAASLVWLTDNFVISHFLSVDDVTPYSIAFKMFTYTFLISATINGVIAPIYGNAYADGDWGRIKKYSSSILKVMVVAGGLIWVLLLFFSKEMITLWTHNDEVFGGFLLFFSLGLYGYILSYVNTFATVTFSLNWADRVSKIIWAEALLNLALSIVFISLLGIGGVALATALSALVTSALYIPKVIKKASNNRIVYDYTYLKKHFFYLVFPAVLVSIGSIYIDDISLKILLFFVVVTVYVRYSWCFLSEEDQRVVRLLLKR